ncbi:hypothetical protein [Dorea longicatena]|uniref:hypothetical protein n=1 Tax=Dorea longicatena TaxID=88431 RepID=UPI002E8E28C4|nr:hypothetical protein [Dorea longicatena]
MVINKQNPVDIQERVHSIADKLGIRDILSKFPYEASRLLLETMADINKKMQATILMVTHDPFSASFCERILFLKDGKIFNEIFRGEKAEKVLLNLVLPCIAAIQAPLVR